MTAETTHDGPSPTPHGGAPSSPAIQVDSFGPADFVRLIFGEALNADRRCVVWSKGASAEWCATPEAVAEAVSRMSPFGETYISCCLQDARAEAVGERGGAETTVALGAVWVDLDIGTEGHAGHNYPPTLEAALDCLARTIEQQPSLIIFSGGGVHLWWLLDEVLEFESDDDRRKAATIVARFQARIREAWAEKGWHLDSTQDLARVLRPPQSLNHKYTPARLVRATAIRPDSYAPSDLLEYCPQLDAKASSGPKSGADGLIISADRRPSAELLAHLRELDPKFNATWLRQRPDLKDQSQSTFDLSLMTRALLAGCTDQEAVDTTIAHRVDAGGSPKRPDYYGRTLQKAKESANAPRSGHLASPAASRAQPPAIDGEVVSVSTPQWRAFPIHVLPAPVRRLVQEGARAIGCDATNVALPALALAAGAIGNTRRIVLKRGWAEPAIIWAALIGASGKMRKSPAHDVAARPIREMQAKALATHKKRMKGYTKEVVKYKAELVQWKARNKKSSVAAGDPPDPPAMPLLVRWVVSDVTVEALVPILQENPRGVTLERDELAGWLKGFNQYKSGGQGSDVAHWLEAFRGGPWVKDRRTNREVLHVPHASVSVVGTTQPKIAQACLRKEFYECGLAARLLVAAPPARVRRWTEDEVSPETELAWTQIIEGLCNLKFANEIPGSFFNEGLAEEEDKELKPLDLELTPEARARFARFVNEHGQRTAQVDDDTGAAFAKLEGYAARFALVLHLMDAVCGVPGVRQDGPVGLAHIEAGITLTEWFANEAERIYAMFRETPEEGARRELVDHIHSWGGAASARDLMRRVHRIHTSQQAEAALQDLVTQGLGRWVDRPAGSKGGRPARVLELIDPSPVDIDTTPTSSGGKGVVSTTEEQADAT